MTGVAVTEPKMCLSVRSRLTIYPKACAQMSYIKILTIFLPMLFLIPPAIIIGNKIQAVAESEGTIELKKQQIHW